MGCGRAGGDGVRVGAEFRAFFSSPNPTGSSWTARRYPSISECGRLPCRLRLLAYDAQPAGIVPLFA